MQDFDPTLLFDRININSDEDYEKFIDELNFDQATFVIKIALEKAYISGIFSLPESEILSKALRIKNKNDK